MEDQYHIYQHELVESDPIALKPSRITVDMKPHQLVGLAKAIRMEKSEELVYSIDQHTEPEQRDRMRSGIFKARTNVGIIGDIVGYGKTLTALSIIAAATPIVPYTNHTYSFHGRHVGRLAINCDISSITQCNVCIQTSLVVVPRGPVYMQWLNAIRTQTTFKVLALDSIPTIRSTCPPPDASMDVLKRFFEEYDVVLIKNTTIKNMLEYYRATHLEIGWNRIIVDEAHDIIKTVPSFLYNFLWLVTASYKRLPFVTYAARNYIVNTIHSIVTDDNIPFLLVKSSDTFVRSSFFVPTFTEHTYICTMPVHLNIVRPFLNQNALERLNANDITGAIREMGGSHETEDDLVSLVTRDINKDIHNKELEEQYVMSLDVPEEVKAPRLRHLHDELTRLRDRLQALTDRISQLSTKTCSICYDTYANPIMLECTHIFCGTCFMKWVQLHMTCPECRTRVSGKQIVAIVDKKEKIQTASQQREPEPKTKMDKLVELICNKRDGKFLVVSMHDNTFRNITQQLDSIRVSYSELKGSTATMMRILQRFQAGEIQVILLNTQHAGSGIDLSCATDVILFHHMPHNKMQAVGRAQRVGRRDPLIVHNLCYPHELELPSTS